VLCVYAMFLIALSSIALAVLLALGPLFFALLFFDATRRFFTAWIAQLANYGLITILTVMVAALLLKIVQSYAAQTAARGAAILTVDALNMMLIALLVFLVLRQVMPIASGLAGGVSLSSSGVASGLTAFRRGVLQPAKNVAPYVAGTLGAAALGAGLAARDAAAHSRQALAGSWRDWRR
jgi:type IV secretion system protein VirB6